MGRAVFLFDALGCDSDVAAIGFPIGAREEAAMRIIDPGIQILIPDAGQIGVGP